MRHHHPKPSRSIASPLASLAALALVAAACGGGTDTAAPPDPTPAATRAIPEPTAPTADQPGEGESAAEGELRTAEVDGRRLAYRCEGEGSPTVILEEGLTGPEYLQQVAPTDAWPTIRPAIAEFTRVCSYDRAGVRTSDPAGTGRTAQAVADDLAALLRAAELPGPYVLAGHSFGGLPVRILAGGDAIAVAALVLIDSSHPDQTERLQAAAPDYGFGFPSFEPEFIDFEASLAETAAVTSIGDTPLVVLTRDRPTLALDIPWFPGLDDPELSEVFAAWLELQDDLTGLSSNATLVVAENSGHFIPTDNPDAIVDAVRTAVELARQQ